MPSELKMPALSPTMEKGTLARWLVKKGDIIRAGDLIAEIETDKATMEIEAFEPGRVVALLVSEGTDNVAVGAVIALIGEGDTVAAPARAPVVVEATATIPEPAESHSFISQAASASLTPPIKAIDRESVDATPLARRLASAGGVSLLGVTGSGAQGRIIKSDLKLPPLGIPVVVAEAATVVPKSTIAPALPTGVPVETSKLSGMRKTIARRLSQSKANVPHFYLTTHCNLDALLKLRGELNAGLAERGIKLSVNDMLIKAMALAMIEVPDTNVQFTADELHRFGRIDISMAVAIDGGLITPVIKDAGSLSLSAIAQQSRALAAKAREGTLMPEDYEGGTASVSNLGMFGIDQIFPIINPPQALILGIGAGIEQPWKVNGEIGLATILAVTASFDHRAIDGAIGARFMAAFTAVVKNPIRLLS